VESELVERVGAAGEHAATIGARLGHAHARRHVLGHHLGWRMHEDAGLVTVGSGGDGARHKGGSIRGIAGDEPDAGQPRRLDPVDPERAPVVAPQIAGDKVPAIARLDEPVWLGRPRSAEAIVAPVAEL